MEQNTTPISQSSTEEAESLVVEAIDVDNAVLQRLIEEVKLEQDNQLHAYNRQHNRHNRGR